MKSLLIGAILVSFLVLQTGAASARQYRGRVNMRGPIHGRRAQMRAPIHAARHGPNPAYNTQYNWKQFKHGWSDDSIRYNWNYQFKDVNSTSTYRQKGYSSQKTDYQGGT